METIVKVFAILQLVSTYNSGIHHLIKGLILIIRGKFEQTRQVWIKNKIILIPCTLFSVYSNINNLQIILGNYDFYSITECSNRLTETYINKLSLHSRVDS